MALTILNSPADNTYQAAILLPDSGTTITVYGAVNPLGINGATDTPMTGSPLTAPSPPASGNIFWLIEVNKTTGALDLQQSTVSMPSNNPNCQTIFQQTLAPAQSDPSLVPTNVTPDV